MVNLNSLFSTLLNTQLCPFLQPNLEEHHEKLLLLADLCVLFSVLALCCQLLQVLVFFKTSLIFHIST